MDRVQARLDMIYAPKDEITLYQPSGCSDLPTSLPFKLNVSYLASKHCYTLITNV
jgi:hypothetical protein